MSRKLFAALILLGLSISAVSAATDDRPLRITGKPVPQASDQCSQRRGRVAMTVTFHESGKVTEVEITSPSGCGAWDAAAFAAARKIKFEPAVKNGSKITVTKRVEYTFTLF